MMTTMMMSFSKLTRVVGGICLTRGIRHVRVAIPGTLRLVFGAPKNDYPHKVCDSLSLAISLSESLSAHTLIVGRR